MLYYYHHLSLSVSLPDLGSRRSQARFWSKYSFWSSKYRLHTQSVPHSFPQHSCSSGITGATGAVA